jgi:hypothetical protein
MSPWAYIWFALVAMLFVVPAWRARQRKVAMQNLAARRGFEYLGKVLPRSLTFSGTALERMTSVWNAIDGDCHGIRVIVFDCRLGDGKVSWRRTVFAAQTHECAFKLTGNAREFAGERAGDWTIRYEPRRPSLLPPGFLPVPEIESLLDSIRP